MDTTNKIFTKATVLIFAIGIVVGFGSASLWMRKSQNKAVAREEQAPTVSQNAVSGEQPGQTQNTAQSLADISASVGPDETTNAIAVADQASGDTVNISSLTLGRAAWVAIHEDIQGAPGKILGAQFFPAGTRSGTVDLLRGTEEGALYYAMIHADDGDHAFDPAKDLPLKNAQGNHIMAKFSATNEAENVQ